MVSEESIMVVLVVLAAISTALAQSSSSSCLVTNNDNGPPELVNYGNQYPRLLIHDQAIIPSYKLDCCGNITEWGVDVHRGGQGTTDRYTLDLQVWRPSPTVNDSNGTGCYSLVGNNRFTSIPLQNLVARVTPSPQDYIPFRPGDVLGVYVENARESDDGVVILTSYDRSTDFTSELVWHASITPTMATSQNGDCPYSVGSNGGILNTLIQGAPVVSVSIAMYSCFPTPLATAPMATQVSTPINSEMPFPITSPSLSTDGGARAFISATPLYIVLITGTVIPLLLVIIVLTIVVIVLVAVLWKTKHRIENTRDRKTKTSIPIDLNVAYGLTQDYQEVDSICMEIPSLHIYERLPSLSTSSRNRTRNSRQSLIYNEAYVAARNEALTADFLNANETIL